MYPNLPQKTTFPSITNPRKIIKYYSSDTFKFFKANKVERAYLVFSKRLFNSTLEFLKEHNMPYTLDLPSLLKGSAFVPSKRVIIRANFGFGAPVTAIVMEELIALGVQEFIFVGMAGAIGLNLNVGDIMVPTAAIADEGTSYHYVDYEKMKGSPEFNALIDQSGIGDKTKRFNITFPDLEFTYGVVKKLRGLGFSVKTGLNWTTDAPYRETPLEIETYRQAGVLTVEMEASAIFAVAQYRSKQLKTRIKTAGIFVISDILDVKEHKPAFFDSIPVLAKVLGGLVKFK